MSSFIISHRMNSVSCSTEVYAICMQSKHFDIFEKLIRIASQILSSTHWYCFLNTCF